MRYQHKHPVRTDDDRYHEQEPEPTITPSGVVRQRCKYCGMALIIVGPNEGPESLKALLTF